MSKLKEYDDSYRTNSTTLIAFFFDAVIVHFCGIFFVSVFIFQSYFYDCKINDSKKLTDKQRRSLFIEIKEKAIFYHISIISPQTIDEINILEASRLGMQQALDEMIKNNFEPDVVITDYMKLNTNKNLVSIKKGDATSLSVAAASILAKVTRDDILMEIDKKYPDYGFAKHKGYPTKAHLEALEKYGIIDGIYRKSYGPVKKIIEKA